MDIVVRAIRSEDWEQAKALRLAALRDPLAPVAFLETYEQAVTEPDAFWQQRTDRGAEGESVRQFVAEQPGGGLVGTVSVLVERAGADAGFGSAAQSDQTHVVGVFVLPQYRGQGVADELFRQAIDWSWTRNEPRIDRVRLYVHEANPRAAAFYRRVGFVPSGGTVPVQGDASAVELEYEIRRPVSYSPEPRRVEPGEWPELQAALDVVNRDVLATLPGQDALVLMVVPSVDGDQVYVALPDGRWQGNSVESDEATGAADRLAVVAEAAQETVMELLWRAWPICPAHGIGMHLQPADPEDPPVWWCRGGRDGVSHSVAAVGGLMAG